MGFYRRKDRKNSWKFEYYMGYKPNGKRKVITKTVKAKNEREAKRLYHLWVAEIELGEYQQPSKMSFQKFIEEKWLPLHAKVELEPNTYDNYLTILKSIFIPHLGAAKLEDIKTIDLQELFVTLSKNRKPATLQRYKVVLSNVFNRATDWGYLKENPVNKIKVKGLENHPKTDTFTIEELKNIISLVDSEGDIQWSLIVHLALYCGLRRSEIIGLTWDKVNFENKVITISHSLTLDHRNIRNQLRLKSTKSSNVRFVPINNKVLTLLKKQKEKKIEDRSICKDKWYNDGNFYVISTDFGKPYRPDSISKRWRRFRIRHGIRKLGFHYLRHSCATFLYHNNVDLKTISIILGHSNIRTTADLYTHIYDEAIMNAAKTFNKLDIQNTDG